MQQLSFEVDNLGRGIYAAARLNPAEPPKRGTAEIAVRLRGRGAIVLQPHACQEAGVATVEGAQLIVLRKGIDPRRANYFVGARLALIQLGEQSWFRGLPANEQAMLARDVGAWLVAPTPAFVTRLACAGEDIGAIAASFVITCTCAVMRLTETGGPDSAIATPSTVHRRGRRFAGFGDGDLRELATRSSPRSVRKVTIRDEPGRVALLARP